jgi:hypothetical protein
LAFSELFIIESKLFSKNLNVGNGISLVDSCRVDDEKKDGAAADMTEKVMAEPNVIVSALD